MNIFFSIKNYCSWSISSCPRAFSLQACPPEFKLFSLSTRACLQSCFSCVWLFVTLWTLAHKPPQSVEFSRQEYCSGLPLFLQEIFLTQGWNPGLLCCRQILYHLSHQGSPSSPKATFDLLEDYCLIGERYKSTLRKLLHVKTKFKEVGENNYCLTIDI